MKLSLPVKQGKLLSIIIVNWERQTDTLECLRSISSQLTQYTRYAVILVDNASREGIADVKRERFNFELTIIENARNLGFTGGNNVGFVEAEKKGTPFFLLLNNDTVVLDSSINRALEALMRESKYGVIGIVNYLYDRPKEIWQAGFTINVRNAKTQRVLAGKVAAEIVEVDYVPGSSMMIRAEALKKVGGFDDSYFAFWEEVDLCVRLKQSGYRIGYLKDSRILHKVKSSTSSNLHLYLSTRNKLYFLRKHSSTCAILLAAVLAVSKFLLEKILRKERRKFKYVLMAIWDFHKRRMADCRVSEIMGS